MKAPSVSDRFKRIVSNKTTWPYHRYPWLVQIRIEDTQYCGGTIISPSYVITAGHCAENILDALTETEAVDKTGKGISSEIPMKVAYVAVASQVKDSQFVKYQILKVVSHHQYKNIDNRPIYDVALLKIRDPIIYTTRISPICLPSIKRLEKVGTLARAVGWGGTKEGGSPSSFLKEVDVPIVSDDVCKKSLSKQYFDRLGDFTICAGGEEGKDACQADSGGPLQVKDEGGKWNLIGITSWGDKMYCGRKDHPGIYARVIHFIDWILQETKDSYSCKKRDYLEIEPNLIECGLPTQRVESPGKGSVDDFIEVALKYPFLVEIHLDGVFIGTGALVNQSTILTTTNVIDPWNYSFRNKTLSVYFGKNKFAPKSKGYDLYLDSTVKHVIFHPLANYRFNLCLLRLKLDLADRTLAFHPICVPHFNFHYFIGETMDATGYRIDSSGIRFYVANVILLKNKYCGESLMRYPVNRSFCVKITTNVTENCPSSPNPLLLMQDIGGRMYLMGLAVETSSKNCKRIAYDLNYATPWISAVVSLFHI